MTETAGEARPASRRALVAIAGVALLAGAAVGVGALYIAAPPAGNAAVAGGNCPADAARFAAIDGAARGEVAAMQALETPFSVATLSFEDREGAPRTLADWRGRTLLVNLWATWCAPCREEMPALDALETAEGGERFAVIPISVDRGENEKPLAFYAETGLTALPFLHDPTMNVFNDLKRAGAAVGLPVTLLVDESGCARGVMNGPANWASPDAAALVRAATGGAAPPADA